jgi:Amt family ammonium transporter
MLPLRFFTSFPLLLASSVALAAEPPVLGIVTGMVAGLGTITPASGFVGPIGALIIGGAAGVGGALGTLLTGIFVSASFGGIGYPEKVTMGEQVVTQLVGIAAAAVWSGVLTWVLLKLVDAIAGMRVASEEETEGLDTALHGEKGYNL